MTDSETGITSTYYYDFIDRLCHYTEEAEGYSLALKYTFGEMDEVTQIQEIIDGSSRSIRIAYDDDQRVSWIRKATVKEAYTYDAYSRVTVKATTQSDVPRLNEQIVYRVPTATTTSGQISSLTVSSPVAGGYSNTFSYSYDANGNITDVISGGYLTSYTYDTQNQLIRADDQAAGKSWTWTYDELQRLTSVGTGLYTRSYTYRNQSDTKTTGQVSQVQYTGLPAALSFGYTYDARGNIATYTAPGKGTVTYTYDVQNQLLSAVGDESYTYTYDGGGNILTANGHSYTYGNSQWRDLLTAYDGETITYDQIGNPLSYYNGTRWTFTWENGRSLATATDGTTSVSYAYDANGLRTAKTVGDVTHTYLYASGQLLRETYGDDTLDFFYDTNGHPYALKHNGSTYYYITNLQGDVMYLLDAQGNTVAGYEYDPYGGIVSATGAMAEINPLRYRGYYYDTELGMYYLQSRYYDPVVGRFINADDVALLGVSGTMLGYNLFAYCENNPLINCDPYGYAKVTIVLKVAFLRDVVTATASALGTIIGAALFSFSGSGAVIAGPIGAALGWIIGGSLSRKHIKKDLVFTVWLPLVKKRTYTLW